MSRSTKRLTRRELDALLDAANHRLADEWDEGDYVGEDALREAQDALASARIKLFALGAGDRDG